MCILYYIITFSITCLNAPGRSENMEGAIVDSSTYPDAWSLGLIIPICKKKVIKRTVTTTEVLHYSAVWGKLFTTVLNERLKQYCDINEIIK